MITLYQKKITKYFWEIFDKGFPLVKQKFQEDNPYRDKKHLEKVKQYAALYCLDEKKQSPWRDINKCKYKAKLFGKKASFFKGYVKKRHHTGHAERMLFSSHFKTTGRGSAFSPSKLPKASIMLFYTTYSPCDKCMPQLAEFVRSCKTCSHFALFFKHYYKKDTTVVNNFLNSIPRKQRLVETKIVDSDEITMVLITKKKKKRKTKRKKRLKYPWSNERKKYRKIKYYKKKKSKN